MRTRRQHGMSLIETMIAVAISLIVMWVIINTFILTMRATDQVASQTTVQASARAALSEWESELRDAYAVLTSYTMSAYPYFTFTTSIGPTNQTLVAAVPTLDSTGTPCQWRGITLSYDVIVWEATRPSATATWSVRRRTFVHAYQMTPSYFTRRPQGPDPLFRSLYLGQNSTGNGTPTPTYTMPTTFGRSNNVAGNRVFAGAGTLEIRLYRLADTEVPIAQPGATAVSPPLINAPATMPQWVRSDGSLGVPMNVTNVGVVNIRLQYTSTTSGLRSGAGSSSTQSDTQSISVRLRNKPVW